MPLTNSLSEFIRSALLDSRPIEIRLLDFLGSPAEAGDLAEFYGVRVKAMYRSLGGQDVEATAEEREGTLVIRLKPRDEPPED